MLATNRINADDGPDGDLSFGSQKFVWIQFKVKWPKAK